MRRMKRSAVRRALGFAYAKASGGSMPVSITFITTDRCNFDCSYCQIPHAPTPEMSTDDFKRAIYEFCRHGLTRASFSGGEVMLRRDTVELVTYSKSLGLFTSLNSNGWSTGRHLDELAGVLDMLVVSLDGDREAHDAVCRRPGSYDRVLDLLSDARDHGISTATISVIGPWNLHLLDDLMATASRLGAWAYFQPAQADCYDQSAGLTGGLGASEIHALANALERGLARNEPIAASTGYLARLKQAPKFTSCAKCAAGRFFASVLPDGRVVPCHLTSERHHYPSGLDVGFVKAFNALPRPSGDGCAISPYQESDLIFSLDRNAIQAALRRSIPSSASAYRVMKSAILR